MNCGKYLVRDIPNTEIQKNIKEMKYINLIHSLMHLLSKD